MGPVPWPAKSMSGTPGVHRKMRPKPAQTAASIGDYHKLELYNDATVQVNRGPEL